MADKQLTISKAQQQEVYKAEALVQEKAEVLKLLGQLEAFNFQSKMGELAVLRIAQQLKEGKHYLGLPYTDEQGETQLTQSWEDCSKFLLGIAPKAINEKLQNLEQFGEDFYQASKKVGIGQKDLRQLRKLPDEQRQALVDKTLEGANKDEIKALIVDLTEQAESEKQALQQQLADSQADLEASRELAADKQQEIDALKQRKFKQAAWEQELEDLTMAITGARTLLAQGVAQLNELGNTLLAMGGVDERAREMASERLAEVVLELGSLAVNQNQQLEQDFAIARESVLRKALEQGQDIAMLEVADE
ncbi:hypothetical protein [Agarivorans gilvus]|uniref:Uncharacterized protein n=1 Tax=Agarivorans gilvus TaxID=680279 RepID=A0ABQ1HYK2_9ALTE|nr:hypothetical protein [Agarivorans gilvus]GGA95939.1 hypothetical protein GCM10007414_06010 [Agarivorans gilvus]